MITISISQELAAEVLYELVVCRQMAFSSQEMAAIDSLIDHLGDRLDERRAAKARPPSKYVLGLEHKNEPSC